jgi:hypothetical protein
MIGATVSASGVVLTQLFLAAGLAAPAPRPADMVPDDFKIVARYGPGYSDWKGWTFTITSDGKVEQKITGGRGGGEPMEKQATLKKEDVADLLTKVKDAGFFKLKERYAARVTDNATLFLEITMDGKTHKVALYAYPHLKEKDDQEAADRFLKIWAEVLRKVPAPNPEQTPELYKPGNYRNKPKDQAP